MLRALVGLLKGLVVGAGIGYGMLRIGATASWLAYVGCALVGALVGVVAGRAPWRAATIWTPVLKLLVGAVIGVGLCALGLHVLPDAHFTVAKLGDLGLRSGPILAPAIGLLYGIFVEVDDGAGKDEAPKKKAAKPT